MTFFQDEADHALIVAKDPPNLDKIPLRMNDIITKLGDIDFEKKIEMEDEDKIMDAKSHPKAVLWASERQRLQSTPNIEVKYKREWVNFIFEIGRIEMEGLIFESNFSMTVE